MNDGLAEEIQEVLLRAAQVQVVLETLTSDKGDAEITCTYDVHPF